MDAKEVVEKIKKASTYVEKKRFIEADITLEKLLKEIEPVEIDKHGKVMDFSTHLEFVLYCNMEKSKKISWTRNYLSDIYLLKGIIQFEDRNFKEAISFYEKALKWNPVSVPVYSEMLEAYIKLKDFDKFDLIFDKAIKVAIRPIDIAMLYKKSGFVWLERGKDEVAYNLFLYSKLFFPRKQADMEIAYLENKFGTKLKYFPDLGVIEYLKNKKLEYQRPVYVIPTYVTMIKIMLEFLKRETQQTRENYLMAIDYYHGLYFHMPSAEIHSALLSMQREYELKFPVGKEN